MIQTTIQRAYYEMIDSMGNSRLIGRIIISNANMINYLYFTGKSEYRKELRKLEELGFDIRNVVKQRVEVTRIETDSFVAIHRNGDLWFCRSFIPIKHSKFSRCEASEQKSHLTDIIKWLYERQLPANDQVCVFMTLFETRIYSFDDAGMISMVLECS